MPGKNQFSHLSEDELIYLMREKLRARRTQRVARYRQTGRAVRLVNDAAPYDLTKLRTEAILDERLHGERSKSSGKPMAERLLRAVEIAGLLAFLAVAWAGLAALRQLNQKTVSNWDLPILTATPLIQAVVLPSGHTSPASLGGARPNLSEIPEHLRPQVNSYYALPLPTPAPEHAVRILIPAIDVDAPVVQGDGWEQLKKGVAQRLGTPNPGQKGNVVLSGHNDIFGEVFRDLDRLRPGDQITLFTSQRSFTYQVVEWFIVEPTRVEVMDPTPDATITLISCYPYLIDTQRIIVKAKLV